MQRNERSHLRCPGPSPITDGAHVWAQSADGRLSAFDFSGVEVWSVDLAKRYGKLELVFGLTSTPVMDGDRLYLQLIHGDMRTPPGREAQVVCLDKFTGKEIWHVWRESDARSESKHSYASPLVHRQGEIAYLITHGADYVMGHSLEDGRELWRCGGLNPASAYNSTLRLIASPTAADGMVVVPSAKNGPVICLNSDLTGDITGDPAAQRWRRAHGTPDLSSPLIHDGLVYWLRESGLLVCMDGDSGEQVYEERLPSHSHNGSLVVAAGRIYVPGRDGRLTVVQAGRVFETLAENDLEEPLGASPAIAHGRMYLRTHQALWAIAAEAPVKINDLP